MSLINLSALWKIVVFGLLAGAGLPAIFAVGLLSLSRGPKTRTAGADSEAVVGGSLAGMIIAAVCFLKVAEAGITTFSEVRDGRATWGKFGGIMIVGVVLLVLVIWLLGKSAEIVT